MPSSSRVASAQAVIFVLCGSLPTYTYINQVVILWYVLCHMNFVLDLFKPFLYILSWINHFWVLSSEFWVAKCFDAYVSIPHKVLNSYVWGIAVIFKRATFKYWNSYIERSSLNTAIPTLFPHIFSFVHPACLVYQPPWYIVGATVDWAHMRK